MGKRSFAFERGGPKELRLRWRRGFRDFQVSLGGDVWKLDRASLAIGATIALPDGSAVRLQTEKRQWWSIAFRDELLADRNGLPLPGSDGDPRVIARGASSVILLFGLLRAAFVGLWALFSESAPALGVLVGVDGVLLFVLGILASFGKRLPIALAAGLLGLELAASLALAGSVRPGGLLIQTLVIVHLVRAWRRMQPRVDAKALASVFE